MEKQLTSLQHPLVKHLTKLRLNRDYREDHGTLLVEGKKLITEIALHLPILTLVVKEGITPPVKAKETFIVTEALIDKISGTRSPEGVLAEVAIPPPSSFASFSRVLALEGIQDPGNMGTLIRTALAFGWEGIFLIKGCVDPYNDKALRAAKGATFRLPLLQGTLEELISTSRQQGWKWVAADLNGEPATALSPPKKMVLLLGNEGEGLSQEALSLSQAITIPMSGKMESLNVAVAGGILMHLLRKEHG